MLSWLVSFFQNRSAEFRKHEEAAAKMLIEYPPRDALGRAPLHLAVLADDLKRVESLLESGANIDIKDDARVTPLFLAVENQRLEIVHFLLERNASLYNESSQLNIVERAKIPIGGNHTPLSKLLKRRMELNKDYLESLFLAFKLMLKHELEIAKKLNKKILILLGESHGQYNLYQLEKIILKAMHEVGITTLYAEAPNQEFINSSVYFFLKKVIEKNKYNVNFKPTDTHPQRGAVSTYERNVYIKNEIVAENKDGVLICGADHMQSLLEEGDAKIPHEQYHVIPINLSSIIQDIFPIEFARDASNVIQVLPNKDNCFSDIESVINRWNNRPYQYGQMNG